jgi:hypothetical protein
MTEFLYLDADDEITTAVARIRSSAGPRVVLVLPPGSRLATSRINFRLLAREAIESNRRLSIVAPDAASRSIAAAAGLTVHASAAEAELDPEGRAKVEEAAEQPVPAEPAEGPAPDIASETVTEVGIAVGSTEVVAAAGGLGREEPAVPPRPGPIVEPRPRSLAAGLPAPSAISRPPFRWPFRWPDRWPVGTAAVVAGLLVVAVAAFGVGWYVLPSATVTITPRQEVVGPVELSVRADPLVTVAQPSAGVVPALRPTQDLAVSGQFSATGQRVAQTSATGSVRWQNCDPTQAYTIPKATTVRTAAGVAFTTDGSLLLQRAIVTGNGQTKNLECQTGDVGVTAASPGPEANVPAGTITLAPFNSFISVKNPAPTAGGTRKTFTRISQADIDAATAQLTKELKAAFTAWAAAPPDLPAGAHAYPATAALGTSAPTPDPATLVGKEVPSFELGLGATAEVTAVDQATITALAGPRLAAAVTADAVLVEGSTRIVVGDGRIDGAAVIFPVTVQGLEIHRLDEAALRARISGRSLDEARRLLADVGTVGIETWPGYVSSIPTLGARVTIQIIGGAPASTPSPSP